MATHSRVLNWRIPLGRSDCQAAVHGVTKSQTRLKHGTHIAVARVVKRRRQWHPTPVLAWRIPWMEEPGRLQSMGLLESDTTE